MAYIPKNRIQPNLYTAGDEYFIPGTNPNYVGFYYALYTGEKYTGKNQNDKPNYRLVPIEEYNIQAENNPTKVEVLNNYENLVYGELRNINNSITVYSPQLYYTQPTEDNYKLGEFQRFFCKKRNEFVYLEISESDYNKLIQQDTTIYYYNWVPFSISWTLTGERDKVYYINRNMVLLEEKNKNFYGLGRYLQDDYLKYYKS